MAIITVGSSAANGGAYRGHGVRGGLSPGRADLPAAVDGRRAAGGNQVRLQRLVVRGDPSNRLVVTLASRTGTLLFIRCSLQKLCFFCFLPFFLTVCLRQLCVLCGPRQASSRCVGSWSSCFGGLSCVLLSSGRENVTLRASSEGETTCFFTPLL